jgi:choline-sulfatase
MLAHEETMARYDLDRIRLPATLRDDGLGRPAIYRRQAGIWSGMTERHWAEAIACYYGNITEIDTMFGGLVDIVEEAGQLERTIIIVTSDHGKMVGAHGIDGHHFVAYEEAYNIPLIVCGPGIAEGAVSDARVGLHDLCPTVLELASANTIDVPDSTSFTPVLRDPGKASAGFQQGYAENHGCRYRLTQRVLWDGPWKFVFNGFDDDELYNHDEDPGELRNLASDPAHQGRVRDMMRAIWHVVHRTGDRTLGDSQYPTLRIAAMGPGRASE